MEWINRSYNVKVHYLISFSDIVFSTNQAPDLEPVDEHLTNVQNEERELDDNETRELLTEAETFFVEEEVDEMSCMDSPSSDKKKKKNSSNTRKKWSLQEEEEIKRLFKTFFVQNIRPKSHEIRKIMSRVSAKGPLHKRSTDTLKKKIFRMLESVDLRST